MAIQLASANLYTGIRCFVVDKNISANLTSSFSLGNLNRPNEEGNTVYPNVLAFRVYEGIIDLEMIATLNRVDERLKTFGGGNNVITPGTPRVIDNTNNAKINTALVCKFPTYLQIDVERLGIPEGTDCIVEFEEGWVLDGDYPNSTFAPSPEVKNFFTFRTPFYGGGILNAVANISYNIERRRQGAVNALSLFSPNFRAVATRSNRIEAEVTSSLSSAMTYTLGNLEARFLPVTFYNENILGFNDPIIGDYILARNTRVRFHEAAFTTTSQLTLPISEIVIGFSIDLVSEFNKSITNGRIRYLFNQTLTSNVQTNIVNSRTKDLNSTITSVSLMSAILSLVVTETTLITNPDGSGNPLVNESFGTSLSLNDNTVIVGQPRYGVDDIGRAYVFSASTGALIRTFNNPSSVPAEDDFGYDVDVFGNYAVIGARQEDGPSSSFKGVAYLYNISTGALLQTRTNLNNVTDYYFGSSVAIDGDYWVAGAFIDGIRVYPVDSGTTYNFGEQTTSDRQFVVDISGDRVIVGVRRITNNSTDTYKVYQYSLSGGGLVRTINNPNPFSTEQGDNFGGAVAVFGDFAVIGAPGEDQSGTTNVGKAYIFNLTNGNLVHTLSNPSVLSEGFNNFASSVDINRRYAIISDGTEVHIFNVLDGTLEKTIGFSKTVSQVSISGNKFIVSFPSENSGFSVGTVRVFLL